MGRFDIVKLESLKHSFKIPTIRNAARTAPYMHNGMFKTLREVLHYYNQPDTFVKGSIHRDLSLSEPLRLTEGELDDLEEFLKPLLELHHVQVKYKAFAEASANAAS